MTNPFEGPEDVEETASREEAEAEEMDFEDVDVEQLEDLEDEVEESAGETKPAKEKKVKEPKAPARPPVPEGFVTPVAFARILTEQLHAMGHSNRNGRIGGDGEECDHKVNPVPPQMVYSYIKNNGADSRNPLPTYEEGGRENLLKPEEALEWWVAMIKRVKASKAAKAEKDAAKAEKAKTKETLEVEESELTEVGEVEEVE